jgi:5-hydroxyisourate hydrolase
MAGNLAIFSTLYALSSTLCCMSVSTHILDTANGRPAANVALALWQLQAAGWKEIGKGLTDADGRCKTLLGDAPLQAGEYSIRFETGAWYEAQNIEPLYPHVAIIFTVRDPTQHHHIPLLLTANGYTTYRGS